MKIVKVEFDADQRKCYVMLEDGSTLDRVTGMTAQIQQGGVLEVTLTVVVLPANAAVED